MSVAREEPKFASDQKKNYKYSDELKMVDEGDGRRSSFQIDDGEDEEEDDDATVRKRNSSKPLDLQGVEISPREIVKITSIVSLGGILSGYHLAVTGVALPALKIDLSLTSAATETVTGCLYLGGALGCLLGGVICDYFGRKFSIVIVAYLYAIGIIVTSVAGSFQMLVYGRIITGFATTYSSVANVAYLTEIAPKGFRGAMVSGNELFKCVGTLAAYSIGYALARDDEEGDTEGVRSEWRIMFGCSGIVAFVQIFLFWRLPESVVWKENAERMRHENSRPLDFESMEDVTLTDAFVSHLNNLIHKVLWNDSVALTVNVQYYKRAFFIVTFLAVAQQTCGHVNILTYQPDIFAEIIGFSSYEEQGNSKILFPILIIALMKIIISGWVVWEVDTGIGRRKLLVYGQITILFSLFCEILAFSGVEQINQLSIPQKVFAMVGTAGVVVGYATSYGPLFYVMSSEIFPTSIRGRMLGLNEAITSTVAYFISFTFLTGQDTLSPAAPYVFYFIWASWALFFAAVAVPDTGVTTPYTDDCNDLKLIDAEMKKLWLWRPTSMYQEVNEEPTLYPAILRTKDSTRNLV